MGIELQTITQKGEGMNTRNNFDNPEPEEAQEVVLKLLERVEDSLEATLSGEQHPDIAKRVLSTLQELSDIGYWQDESNSTKEIASCCLDDYNVLEKRRVEFLSAKKAYETAEFSYNETACKLSANLTLKGLDPQKGTAYNPLKWFLTGKELVSFCRRAKAHPPGEGDMPFATDLTVRTLRRYQSLKLIPKPIRLGHKGYYSFLTVLRLAIIQGFKREGYKLAEIKKDDIDKSLKKTLAGYLSTPDENRNWYERVCASMVWLVDASSEDATIQLKDMWQDLVTAMFQDYKKSGSKI